MDLDFVNQVKQAFGYKDEYDGEYGTDNWREPRIYYFLMNGELAECKTSSECWKFLWEKICLWKKEYLLWKDSFYYICGVTSIYNLLLSFCRLRIPSSAPENWIEYLYHMSLIALGEYIGEEGFMHRVKYADDKINTFNTDWYFVESDYTVMTSKEWLAELEDIGRISYKRFQWWLYESGYAPYSVEYREIMEENYPKFKEDFNYLKQNVHDGGIVVRMNKLKDDQEVWYFAKIEDSLYVIIMRDEV